MRLVHRTFLPLLVWLTATATLLAGIPHFTCRCPNGRVKPFCFGSASKQSCCCGDKSCCSAESDRCCCHGGKEQAGLSTRSLGNQSGLISTGCRRVHHAEIQPSRCAKTPAQLQVLSAENSRVPDSKDTLVRPHFPLISPAVEAVGSPRSRKPCAFWSDGTPPPLDLVIALRHLVI